MALHQMVKVTFHWDLDVHCPCSPRCVLTKSMVPRVLIGALKRGKCFEKDWTACCEKKPATIKIMTCGGKISLSREKKDEHHHTHSGGISGEPNYPIEKGDYSFLWFLSPPKHHYHDRFSHCFPYPSCLHQNLTFHKFNFNRRVLSFRSTFGRSTGHNSLSSIESTNIS